MHKITVHTTVGALRKMLEPCVHLKDDAPFTLTVDADASALADVKLFEPLDLEVTCGNAIDGQHRPAGR